MVPEATANWGCIRINIYGAGCALIVSGNLGIFRTAVRRGERKAQSTRGLKKGKPVEKWGKIKWLKCRQIYQ